MRPSITMRSSPGAWARAMPRSTPRPWRRGCPTLCSTWLRSSPQTAPVACIASIAWQDTTLQPPSGEAGTGWGLPGPRNLGLLVSLLLKWGLARMTPTPWAWCKVIGHLELSPGSAGWLSFAGCWPTSCYPCPCWSMVATCCWPQASFSFWPWPSSPQPYHLAHPVPCAWALQCCSSTLDLPFGSHWPQVRPAPKRFWGPWDHQGRVGTFIMKHSDKVCFSGPGCLFEAPSSCVPRFRDVSPGFHFLSVTTSAPFFSHGPHPLKSSLLNSSKASNFTPLHFPLNIFPVSLFLSWNPSLMSVKFSGIFLFPLQLLPMCQQDSIVVSDSTSALDLHRVL